MRKLLISALLLSLSVTAQAYSIKHSYSAKDKSVEFYGACNDGQMLKVIKHADGRYSYEGPAGGGTVKAKGPAGLDKAASAACGE